MLVDHLPTAGGIRVGGHPFKHQRGCTVRQGAVYDVAVASDPAHIRRTPVNVTFLVVKYIFMGHGRLQQIATGGVQHPLGFAGRARGIQNE